MMTDTGIESHALRRYIEEQIFSLPGVDGPRECLSVILTGSRATGAFTPESDVDLEVLCPREVCEAVQQACFEDGLSESYSRRFFVLPKQDWRRYFGPSVSRPHFSLTPLEDVARAFREYDDVLVWIHTNARVIHDPGEQFKNIVGRFAGYPRDVLVRKLKYRWLLAAYWSIDVYPLHHSREEDVAPALAAIPNAVHEWLRFFFLAEGKPFPYTERLVTYGPSTRLGRQFTPHLLSTIRLALGQEWPDKDVWTRLDEACRRLCDSNGCPDFGRMEEAGGQAMLAAGVEPEWVEADYGNIDELLMGHLGPVP